MPILDQAVELVTTSPGDLVYYLVTLFAIEAVLAMAIGEWLRERRTPQTRRWVLAGLGLFLTRGALMLAGLLAWRGVWPPQAVMPPLERFMDALALLFIGWAALPLSDDYPAATSSVLAVSLLAGLLGYAAAATVWYQAVAATPDLVFNGYMQDLLWTVVGMGTLGLIGVGAVVRRGGQWRLLVGITALALAGYAAHLVSPGADPYAPAWVRLANLAVYPLTAGLVYRQVLDWEQQARTARRSTGAPLNWELLEALEAVGASLDLDTTLVTAVAAATRLLRADVCALGVPTERSHRHMELALVHASDRSLEEGERFQLDAQPLIRRAIRTRRQQVVQEANGQVAGLYALMGEPQAGPILLQPLVDDRVVVGVLIAGNPRSGRPWADRERRLAEVLGRRLALAIGNAQRFHQKNWQADQLTQHVEAERQRARQLQLELEQSRQEAQTFAQRILDLEQQLERHKRQSEELAAVLQMVETEPKETALQTEIERLNGVCQELEAQVEKWRERARELTARQTRLEAELSQAEQTVNRLQAELMEQPQPQSGDGAAGPVGVVVSDYTGQIAALHGAVEHVLGRDRSQLVGQPILELYADSRWRQTLERLMVDEDVRHHVVDSPYVLNVQQGEQTVHVELTPVSPPDQQGFNGIVAVIYPEGAISSVSYQAELVASLVQELRTPMTSIIGYTDLLLGESVGILGAMQRKFLQRVKANTERMSAKLDDLIEITSIDLGQLEIRPEKVSMVSIIEDAIMSTSGQFRERGITVDMALDDNLPYVQADPDALHQVMMNLLSNACQASAKNTTVVVTATVQDMGDTGLDSSSYLMVSVTDTGGGISEQDRRRVFTRLYRADNPLIEGLGETGVGLSVAKTLVEAHGGRIWVESEEGVGSTFSFLLPVQGASFPAGGSFGEAKP